MEDNQLKQRVVGAIVLVSLAVIFIPMILSGSDPASSGLSSSIIPQKPEHDFVSRIIPIERQAPDVAAAPAPEMAAKPDSKQAPVVKSAAKVDSKPVLTPPAASKPRTETKTAKKTVSNTAATSASDSPPVVRKGLEAWVVQVGSFSSKENAFGLRDKLRGKGFPSAFVDSIHEKDKTTYRVRIGPEVKKTESEETLARLKKMTGSKGFVTHYP